MAHPEVRSWTRAVDPEHAILLGFPLDNGRCVSRVISEKTAALRRVGKKFVVLAPHDVFILLRHSFAIPKLQYLLHTALCYQLEVLVEYDNTLRSIMGEVINTAVMSDDCTIGC